MHNPLTGFLLATSEMNENPLPSQTSFSQDTHTCGTHHQISLRAQHCL